MSKLFSRRGFLSGASALIGLPGVVAANAPQASLRPQLRGGGARVRTPGGLDALIERAALRGEVVCAVANVKTGQKLESLGGQTGLPPASVAKALTTLYALEVLGSEYRFETRVLASGAIEGGVLQGDLVLAGGGDPTLTTTDLARLAASLKAAGVREVRGDFVVAEGALPYAQTIDKGQPEHVGYSPAISGIALNFNRVYFEWKRGSDGYRISMDARTKKYRPEVQTAQMKVVRRKTPIYSYADKAGRDHWTVASAALGKEGGRWLPVRNPAAYAGDVFRTLARSHGIVLPQAKLSRSKGQGRVLALHHSLPLRSMLKDMLKYSTNITAEMVGMTTSVARIGQLASLKQSALEMSKWAERAYGMKATRLVDHSGLGDASRMTPEDLVGALVQVRKQDVLRPLLKPFPLRDSKGRIVKAHPIKVDAKTGTLNFVSGLGGFMTAQDGTELAFAIFSADTGRRAGLTRAQRERPDGARAWNRRSKQLQQKLIERWGSLYGS
jgi:serine-type D-Ala-D-Ala carboxypeptidase/endopeptidase (penicillin-binding protein 4)